MMNKWKQADFTISGKTSSIVSGITCDALGIYETMCGYAITHLPTGLKFSSIFFPTEEVAIKAANKILELADWSKITKANAKPLKNPVMEIIDTIIDEYYTEIQSSPNAMA